MLVGSNSEALHPLCEWVTRGDLKSTTVAIVPHRRHKKYWVGVCLICQIASCALPFARSFDIPLLPNVTLRGTKDGSIEL